MPVPNKQPGSKCSTALYINHIYRLGDRKQTVSFDEEAVKF